MHTWIPKVDSGYTWLHGKVICDFLFTYKWILVFF